MISAKRLYVLRSINKENLLLPHISTKRLRGKTLSIFRQDIAKHTTATCRRRFGNSNMKQMRDFPKDKWNCYRDSLRGANQALEDQ